MEKYTIKAEITPRSDRSGGHGIYLRITHRRVRMRISLGRSVPKKQWDHLRGMVKPSHPLSVIINQLIRKKTEQAEQYIASRQLAGHSPTLHQVKAAITGSAGEIRSILQYSQKLAQDMQGKFAPGTLAIYLYEGRRVDTYSPGATFEIVDARWLKGYERYLRDQDLKANCIHKSFKTLAKFFNSARKDGITQNQPFEYFDKPRYLQGDRTYLTGKEVDQVHKALSLPMDARLRRAAVWFLFGCYSGLRFSDWQRFSPAMIRGKDIVIRAKKNGQLVVMPIHSRLKQILAMLPDAGPVEAEPHTNAYLKGLAELCGIDKHLTTHVARHSFAVRCAELGISIETCAELMGINVRTCAIYYKVTGTKVRKEMEKWG